MVKKYKSISINEDVYLIVKDKQEELRKRNNGNYVEVSYVAETAILEGIDKVTI